MSPAAGTRVRHYEIISFVGAGGMGAIYKATDLKLKRTVALKFLPPQFSTGAGKDRFLQEAHAASVLDHPNIGTIHSIEEAEDGRLFIVMSFYDGEDLSAKIRRGPLDVWQAIDIAVQAAGGLAEAHAKGITHRDVKPSNIMVTGQGRVKVLDFGLAKLPGSEQITATGTTVGTAAYMSPEQAYGRPADPRSDIWSLGVVLFEMLSGTLPFRADSVPATLLAITTQRPPQLQAAGTELRHILERCLAKAPEDRYQSMKELISDLSAIHVSTDAPTRTIAGIASTPLNSPAAVPLPAGQTPASRRRWTWPVAAVAVLLIAVLAWWLGVRRGSPSVAHERRVVVLPFSNVGNDPANAALCYGLLETLTSRLTNLEGGGSLWIVPSSEVRRRKIADAAEAHSALGANLVVSGSVQRDPSGVRLTVNLVDAVTLRQVGSTVVDDRDANLSALQDAAVSGLAKLMAVQLTARALGAANGESAAAPAAYESYLKGLSYLQRWDRPESLETAIQMFTTAARSDPSFALAYARLGEALWIKNRLSPDPRLADQALVNAQRAAQLNPDLAPVHVTLGRIADGTGKYDVAVEEFQRALRLDPRNADAYQYVWSAYVALGRPADAEASLKKAAALRPENWETYNALGAFYIGAARYNEAAAAFRKVLSLTPDNAAAYSNLGAVLNRLRERAEALRMLEKAVSISPNYATYVNIAGIYFAEKKYGMAVDAYEKALLINDQDFRTWAGISSAYRELGHIDKSRYCAKRALELAGPAAAKSPNDPDALTRIALLQAWAGNRDAAISSTVQSLALAPDSPDIVYRAALVYNVVGDRESALKYLASALAKGYKKDRALQDTEWRSFRSDSRFQALMR